jgi:hypothetical protein
MNAFHILEIDVIGHRDNFGSCDIEERDAECRA